MFIVIKTIHWNNLENYPSYQNYNQTNKDSVHASLNSSAKFDF